MPAEFKCPDLGENIASGTVGRILVAEGASVSANQPLFELETDKAVTEIPAPSSMTIVSLKVKEGDQVKVGQVLLTYEGGAKGEAAPAKPVEAAPAEPEKPKPAPVAAPTPAAAPSRPAAPREAGGPVLAAPSVRKLAREMGVRIEDVPTSDPSGRVSVQDVMAFAQGTTTAAPESPAPAPTSLATATTASPSPIPSGIADQDRWGGVVRESMNGVRKKTVQHMTRCWTTIPHVTHFEKADITGLESLRQQYAKQYDANGAKLTVTVFLIKVLALALKKFPKFNASIDVDTEEILYKQYCHVGVAVDTPSGLLVPVVRDADKKSLAEIAAEVPVLAAKARDRKLSLEEMQGGCMTITNLGGLGGSGFQNFTPIINAPEVAILGVSRGAYEPVFEQGAFAPRLRLPLALSYDHRLIDGADAARFMRWYVQTLEQPWTLML
ncbi:MAG: hypothetical protein RLZZ303_3030 [Candidatus Hydrogenedentota bacterium]|jgi:pyruvate dehydrogenase E2 component (dihydrolipoamide acetyltransferase)